MNKFFYILLVCIALVFTILGSRLIPEKYLEPYNLELDSIWHKVETDQEYTVDVDNDNQPESFLHHNINKSGHSIEFRQNSMLREIYIFRENEFFISPFLYFADINRDYNQELIFVSAEGNTTYLNILEYKPGEQLFSPVEKAKIDTFSFFNNTPDIINNCLVVSKSCIYFDLHAGYSVQPRNIYKYNFSDKSLSKTKLNSLVNTKLEPIQFNGSEFLLAKEVKATGNTISPEEAESLKNSTNKDTLEIYESVKHLEYQYGDFSSYILLYNQNLGFAFEPIEFFGWTNYTKAEITKIDSIPHIVAITNTEKGDKSNKLVTVCNLQGKIEKQVPMPYDFTDVFTWNGNIIFYGNKTLYLYSMNLEPVKEIKNISVASGFFDINHDSKKEFIAFDNNEMVIFSEGFGHKTTFKIEQEFAPFPQKNGISLLQKNGKSCFVFNTRLFYYLFSYSQNRFAFLKYPFYFLLFAFWLGTMFFIVKLYSRRLEKENQRLEETVAERTQELKQKNLELASQKTEIQAQAKELSLQNAHLEELDKFKRTLTSTLVHDLKNPLGQILSKSQDKTVTNLAGRMLRLITNLLDVEKYEQTDFRINKEMHPLRVILDDVVSSQEISLREKNLEVIINIDNVSVWTDKGVLVRVFENLLSNAIRFSPQNQNIEIVACCNNNETVEIGIKNNGENIPDGRLEHIFDKYIQVHKTGSSNNKNTGLGLTFCKMAIQAHGHTIEAKNFDSGVMFTFCLNGQVISTQKISTAIANRFVVLSLHEKEMLKPWFDCLKTFDIYQVSDIYEILKQIPDSSENIITLKQQISDAVFASNTDLFSRLIN